MAEEHARIEFQGSLLPLLSLSNFSIQKPWANYPILHSLCLLLPSEIAVD